MFNDDADKDTAVTENRPDLTPEEAVELSEDEHFARIAQILSQGRMNSRVRRLFENIPNDRHGILVRERDQDIMFYKDLGFRIESETDNLKGEHSTGDSRVRIGDLILMTTSKKNIEVIRRVEKMQIRKKLDLERDQYKNNAQSNIHYGIVPIDETVRN